MPQALHDRRLAAEPLHRHAVPGGSLHFGDHLPAVSPVPAPVHRRQWATVNRDWRKRDVRQNWRRGVRPGGFRAGPLRIGPLRIGPLRIGPLRIGALRIEPLRAVVAMRTGNDGPAFQNVPLGGAGVGDRTRRLGMDTMPAQRMCARPFLRKTAGHAQNNDPRGGSAPE